jgi:hypothetical protein
MGIGGRIPPLLEAFARRISAGETILRLPP